MVKIKRPLLSSAASGTFARTIAYASTRRGATAGKKRIPKQPRTEAQRATRIWMTWLCNQWAIISTADRATWLPLAADLKLPPYNAFVSYNTKRIKNLPDLLTDSSKWDTWPTQIYPALPTGASGGVYWESITPGPGYLDYRRYHTSINQGWAWAYFRISAEHPGASYANLVAIETNQTIGYKTTRIGNLPPGNTTLKIAKISTTGITPTYWSGIIGTVL